MALFSKKGKKAEVKRVSTPKDASKISKIRGNISPVSIFIWLLFIISASTIIIIGGQLMPWQLGQKPREDIRARVAFKDINVQATEQARKQAMESTPNYYRLNKPFLEQIRQDLTTLYNSLRAIQSLEELPEERRVELKQKWGISTEEDLQRIKEAILSISTEQFQNIVKDLQQRLINSNFIEIMPDEYRTSNEVILFEPQSNITRKIKQWTFPDSVESKQDFVENITQGFPEELRKILSAYLASNLRPVWIFDKAKTDQERQKRYALEENIRYEEFQPGTILVSRSQEIGKRELHLLELEHQRYWQSIETKRKIFAYAGITAIVSIITAGLIFYFHAFARRILQNWSRSLAIAITLALMLLLARLLTLSGINVYATTFEVVLIAMVMTIAYDQRIALMITTTTICLFMIMLNGSAALLLTLFAAGAVSIFTLDDIRTRSKIIEVAGASAIMGFATLLASQLADFQEIKFILRNGLSSAAGSLLAGFVVQGILPVIERLFKIATSMTLLEWSDPSKPLLKKLAIEVPGTFNHSLLIGSLAEAAAEAIGANGLLARVGSYYHDIGKINKPQYFVENQPNKDFSRHKDLSPAMSLLIIIGHVKDGLELAKEYGLPSILHQFIAEHHGTTIVEYFYHQAVHKAEKEGTKISEAEFRYPGPKPKSKESAIVMLADGVEGAARALSEPTASRIEATVHQIVRKRLEDGQLDECELTMKEIKMIEESLTKSLCAIYHSRIKYPSQQQIEQPETDEVKKVAKGY